MQRKREREREGGGVPTHTLARQDDENYVIFIACGR